MRHVVLSFGDDQQLQAATAFLHKAHPLNYTAAVKKSQVGAWRRVVATRACLQEQEHSHRSTVTHMTRGLCMPQRAQGCMHAAAPVLLLQVHHALCEMLTEVLAPLIRSNQPQASLQGLSAGAVCDWYNAVLKLKNEVGQWVNKHSKHTNVRLGLPLGVLCAQRITACTAHAGGLPAGHCAGVPRGRGQLRKAGGEHG
jgi:hypothetical protein